MHRTTILAIDIGTTACKAVLTGPEGSVMGMGQAEYPTYHPRLLWAEQDPENWWHAAVEAARAGFQAAGDRPLTVAAIGLSSQRETVALTDAAGRPLVRAISWMDRRGVEQVRRLLEKLGFEAIHRKTRMVPDAIFTLAKSLWLKEHEPELLARARWPLQPRDFVAHRLTGQFITDPSPASRTMMWEVERGGGGSWRSTKSGSAPSAFPPSWPPMRLSGACPPTQRRLLAFRQVSPWWLAEAVAAARRWVWG